MKKLIAIFLLISWMSVSLHAQSLDEYRRMALKNNPGIQAKYKTFEAAMQKVAQVGNLPDPTLSIGIFVSPVETRVGPQRARFSLTQMFPWFGTLKSQANTATILAEAKFQEFLDAQNKLIYNVSSAYFPLLDLNEQIQLEEENIRILASYKELANVRFKNNKGSMVDVLRVDIMLNDANTTLSILKQQKTPLESNFNALLNREPSMPVEMSELISLEKPIASYRKDSLFQMNPRLQELELKKKASLEQEQTSIRKGMPNIGLGLDYVMIGERSGVSITDNGKDVLMPMVSVSLPIFRGKYKAAQKEAQLMQESYSLQIDDAKNQLNSSYDKVWFELNKQLELIALYEHQVEESQQSLELLFTSYGNSGQDFEDVLRMQQQILAYKKRLAAAKSAYFISLAELDYVTSKSFLRSEERHD